MTEYFSFVSDVVKPLAGLAVVVAITIGVVLFLDMLFPEMSQRPAPQVQVIQSNGYTCVKILGEKASTCSKDAT